MPVKKDEIFENIRNSLLNLDPVAFCEKYLTLEGDPFRLTGNGYKPFADVYRYIAIKALEGNSKPVVIVKGRQVGATTMASALEMYFMGCGLFGSSGRHPIRIIHAFPQLDLAYAYSKTKLNPMIVNSITVDPAKRGQKPKSYFQSILDPTSPTNDSLNFKQFVGGNHIWIESTGETADRLRGRTADIIFFDECWNFDQEILVDGGKMAIGEIYEKLINGKDVPRVLSYNEKSESFEYKKVVNAWCRGKRELVEISLGQHRKFTCTPNHRMLTSERGWQRADNLLPGDLLVSYPNYFSQNVLNDDQFQVALGSFLGDGQLTNYSKKTNSYSIRVIHGASQREYCEWKAQLFNAKTKLVENNGYAKKPAYKFVTKKFAFSNNFPKNKSTCPQWVLDKIDARGLAIWFMDDGGIIKRWGSNAAARISTCSFDEDSQKRIVEKFKSLGIDCRYSKEIDGHYYVYFNKDAFKKLCELISPYVNDSLSYKIINQSYNKYTWSNKFRNYEVEVVSNIKETKKNEDVYDIEVEDNHNFVLTSGGRSKNLGGPVTHNCQDIPAAAIGNATKMLSQAKYGKKNSGVQVYFGTPKQRGSNFYQMWQKSSQQYYNLFCERCEKLFPLYTPGSDKWEQTWIEDKTVECTHCQHRQNKVKAAERGKWVPSKNPDECEYIGFHLSQLFIPEFSKEKIISEKPENSAINTERVYQNEVLGEFFSGESGIITPDEIREKCGDMRKMRANIAPGTEKFVVMGIDIGLKSDMEQLRDSDKSKSQGQSYSCLVVMTAAGPHRLSIEYATKFKRNDYASKKELIDQVMRQYSVNLAVCDLGYTNDFSEIMQNEYGERYLVSQVVGSIGDHIRYEKDRFPKCISFEKDFYIAELYEQMKKGHIRFPYGSYEQINWLVQHCTSMEIKPVMKSGEIKPHYVKGSTPNDGFMALLNGYLAYKFFITKGFTVKNPLLFNDPFDGKTPRQRVPALTGFVPRMR